MVKSLRLGAFFIGIMAAFFFFSLRQPLTPLWENLESSSWLEEHLTSYFQQPVEIGQTTLHWKGLFHPSLELQNFSIKTPEGITRLHARRIEFSLDLIASVLMGKIVPGDVTLEGTSLVLRERGGGLIDINDIPSLQADLKSKYSEKLDNLVTMFLSKGVKQIKDVNIAWYDESGKLILPLSQLNLLGESRLLVQKFSGQAGVWGKTPVTFSGSIYGSYLAKKLLYTTCRLKVESIEVKDNPLMRRFIERFSLEQGNAHLQIAISWKPWHRKYVSGQINVKQVQLGDNKNHNKYFIDELQTQFNSYVKPTKWWLTLHDLQLTLQKKPLPIHEVTFEKSREGNIQKTYLKIDLFPVQQVSNFMTNNKLLSPALNNIVFQTKPSGVIHNFDLHLENRSGETAQKISFMGDLNRINIQQWGKFPGVTNLSGSINFTPTQGTFLLNSADAIFSLKSLFHENIFIKHAKATIDWRRNNQQNWLVNIQDYRIETADGHAMGYIKVLLPNEGKTPYIHSKTYFEFDNLKNATHYFPNGIMSKSLVTWLDHAIKGGRLTKGVFTLDGDTKNFPFDHSQGKFLIKAHLSDGLLHYKEGWPDLTQMNAELLFKGRSMSITSNNAKLMGANVSEIKASIPILGKSKLALDGKLDTLSMQKIYLTKNANPLVKLTTFNPIYDLNIEGQLQLALHLALPLNNPKEKFNYNGTIHFDNVDIKSVNSNVALHKLKGQLVFSDEMAATNALTGELNSAPFKVVITSKQNNENKLTEMNVDSKITLSDLQTIYRSRFLAYFSGDIPFHAKLDWMHSTTLPTQIKLLITSNLKGFKSDLPSPFNKTADSVLPSSLELINNTSSQLVDFKVGDQISGLFNFNDNYSHVLPRASRGTTCEGVFCRKFSGNGQVVTFNDQQGKLKFDRGHLYFGNQKAQLPVAQGLSISGNISRFHWTEWKPILLSHETKKNEESNIKTLTSIFNKMDITIGSFHLSDMSWSPLRIQAYNVNNNLKFLLNSPATKGEINIPRNYPSAPIQANIDKLSLLNKDSMASKWVASEIPALDLTIANLHYKDKYINNIDLKVRPQGKDLLIKQVVINEPVLKISASGLWRTLGSRQETSLNGNLNSKNLGAFLNQWHITNNVVKGEGEANFNLTWTNTPVHPESKTLKGTMDLHFNRGRIIKLGNQANLSMGVGRILNLFSLQTIPRRLKGDFSDLTGSGFSFDELNAHLSFKQGNVFTENSSMEGVVGKIKIKGRIGLIDKDYNLRLVINPNVTSSLPLVATLTAGPIAGAVTWLADKILSRQVKKITEIHYNVTGTWDNPDMYNLSQH